MADELENVRNLQMHMGYKLQAIGKKLAKEFNVWNYQLRNRMIQVGYTAAKGALNFVADDYIEPFAFAAGTCRGNQTFVISPKEMLEEYVRNEAFRKIIDTGHYVYADGHIYLVCIFCFQHIDTCKACILQHTFYLDTNHHR